jgi:Uma2 family endonuclease
MSSAKAVKPRPGRLLMGLPPDTRVVVADVTWNDYARLVAAVADSENCRVAYDRNDNELMNVGPVHGSYSEILGLFVNLVAEELQIDLRGARSTTWRRRKLNRGIEADLSYYVDAAKVAAFDAALAMRSGRIKDYPNPDLAVEVDISRPKIDRQGIYAALQVSEVWRVFDEHVSIDQLQSDGKYVATVSSRFLRVTSGDVERGVLREGARGSVTWKQRLREWVRNELGLRTAQ